MAQLDPITNLPEEKPKINFFGVKPHSNSLVPNQPTEYGTNYDYLRNYGVKDINPGLRNINKLAADYQSTSHKIGNSIARLSNVIPEVIGNLAAIADMADYANQDQEIGNAITEWTKQWKESTNQNFPVYRENPGKPLDIGDIGWWLENGSSLVTSIAGFAITGATTGAGLSLLSKLGQVGRISATIGNAFMLNQAESIQEATDVYQTSFEKARLSGKSIEDATQIAAEAASLAINVNRINIALNLTSANMFIRPNASTRNLVKEVNKLNTFKKAGYESAQEFAEEEVNLVAGKQGNRFAQSQIDGTDFKAMQLSDIGEDIFTMEGLEAGILGAIGGAGQTFLSAGIGGLDIDKNIAGLPIKYQGKYAAQRKLFAEQRDLADRASLMMNTPGDIPLKMMDVARQTQLMKQIQDEITAGNDEKANALKEELLAHQVYQYAEKGAMETLENMFQDIANFTPEQAAEKKLPENYKDLANEAISNVKQYEKIFKQTPKGLTTTYQIYSTLIDKVQTLKDLSNILTDNMALATQFVEEIQTIVGDDITLDDIRDNKEFEKFKEFAQFQEIVENETIIESLRQHIINLNTDVANLIKEGKNNKKVKDVVDKTKEKIKETVKTATTAKEMKDIVTSSEDPETADVEIKASAVQEEATTEIEDTGSLDEELVQSIDDLFESVDDNIDTNKKDTSSPDQKTDDEYFDYIVEQLYQLSAGNGISFSKAESEFIAANNDKLKKALDDRFKKEQKEFENKNPRYTKFKNYTNKRYLNPDGSEKAALLYSEIKEIAALLSKSEAYFFDEDGLSPLEILQNLYLTSSDAVKDTLEQYYNNKVEALKTKNKTTETSTEINNPDPTPESTTSSVPTTKGSTVRGRVILYHRDTTKEKNPELSERYEPITQSGIEALNTPNSDLNGAIVHFEIDPNYTNKDFSNAKAGEDNITIWIVNYKDGNVNNKSEKNRRVVGKLMTGKKADAKFKGIRKTIYQEYKTSKSKDVFVSSYKSKINVMTGEFYNMEEGKLAAVHNVLPSDVPLVFGIGVQEGSSLRLVVPNAKDFNTDKYDFTNVRYNPNSIEKGGVYLLVPTPSGEIYPAGTYTVKLKDYDPEVQAKVKELLLSMTADNIDVIKDQLNKYVSVQIRSFEEGEIRPIISYDAFDKKTGKRLRLSSSKKESPRSYTIDEYFEILLNTVVQVDTEKINTGSYNKQVSETGVVKTSLVPMQHFHSSYAVLQPELFKTEGEPITVDEVEVEEAAPDVAVETKTSSINEPAIVSEIRQNKSFIVLKSDGSAYINTKTGKEYQRVSNFIADKEMIDSIEQNETMVDYEKRLRESGKYNPKEIDSKLLIASSFKIGSKIDKLVRDYFEGTLKDYSEYGITLEDAQIVKTFVEKGLNKLNEYFKTEGLTPIAEGVIVYNDELGVAGELDILAYNEKGELFIFDMKSMRGNHFVDTYNSEVNKGKIKYFNPYREGETSSETKHTRQQSLYRILINNTHGVLVKELKIIPISISYGSGMETTSKLELLDLHTLNPMDQVKSAKLKNNTPKSNVSETTDSVPEKEKVEKKTNQLRNKFGKNRNTKRRFNQSDDPAEFSKLIERNNSKPWNKKRELAKLSKILGNNVAVRVVDNIERIFGTEAYGIYHQGVIFLEENNFAGVPYHEAFHAVFRLFLTKEEQSQIFTEAANKYPKPLKEEIDFYIFKYGDDAIKIYYEEKLAEDYAIYSLSKDTMMSKILPKGILDFFRSIKKWYTEVILGLPYNEIQSLFYNIERGKYKNHKLVRKVDAFVDPAFSMKLKPSDKAAAIKHLQATYNDIMNDLKGSKILNIEEEADDIEIINQYLTRSKANVVGMKVLMNLIATKLVGYYNDALDQIDEGIDVEIAEKIAEKYEDIFEELGIDFDNIEEDTNEHTQNIGRSIGLESVINVNSEGPLYKMFYLSLSRFGIVVKNVNNVTGEKKTMNEELLEDDGEIENTTNDRESWQYKAYKESSFDKVSALLKRKFSFIPKRDSENNYKITIFGDDQYEDPKEIYRFLEQHISNSTSSDEMIEKLKKYETTRPFVQDILQMIEEDKTDTLRAQIWTNIGSKSFDTYVFAKQNKKGETVIFTSNRMSIRHIIINDLKASFSYSKLLEKGAIRLDVARQLKTKIDELRAKVAKPENYIFEDVTEKFSKAVLNKEIVKEIADVFEEYSIGISEDQLLHLANNGRDTFQRFFGIKDKKGIVQLVNALAEGKNLLSEIDTENDEKSTLDDLSGSLVPVTKHVYESSFRNVNNETTYAHSVSNYAKKRIGLLTKDNQYIETLQQDIFFNSSWLLEELKSSSNKELFSVITLDGYKPKNSRKGLQYSDMTATQLEATVINMYYNNGASTGYYRFPILSDAPQLPFIKYKKINNVEAKMEEVIEKYYAVYEQEYARIKKTEEGRSKLFSVKNFKKHQKRFTLLTFMNGFPADLRDDKNEVKNYIRQKLEEGFNQEIERLIKLNIIKRNNYTNANKVKVETITNTDENYISSGASDLKNDLTSFLRDYYYNSKLMNTQTITIFSKDVAFYKNKEDWQKRNKQVWSPGLFLDTGATGVKKTFSVMVLKDSEKPSEKNILDAIESTLKELGYDEVVVNRIVDNFKKNNETDGQGFISVNRYKEIMRGLGRVDRQMTKTFEKLDRIEKRNSFEEEPVKLDKNDWARLGVLKPFMFTEKLIDETIVPIQIKNSEFVLTKEFASKDKSGKLMEIYNKMIEMEQKTETNVAVQFESAIKVGLHNAISLDNVKNITIDDLLTLDNSDYRLQVETPEHFLDTENNFGTQIRKLITADTPYNTEFTSKHIKQINEIFGKDKITFQELLQKYDDTIGQDLFESHEYAKSRVSNIHEVVAFLTEQAIEKELGLEFITALTIKNGEPQIPLWFPIFSKRNEQLLTSIFKNEVTKQKINGGAFVNLSSLGYSDELKAHIDNDGNITFDAMMPWWSKDFFQPLLDKEGNIDINKIPEEAKDILNVIGYRIPTEDKYSMFNIRVVGFTNPVNGGSIVLPREATTLAGLDFDVDKLFIMIPAFRRTENGIEIVPSTDDSKEGRDNLKIDLIRAILSHKVTREKSLQPGGFDIYREAALNVRLINAGKNPSDYLTNEKKQEVLDAEELDITEPSVQTELFERNMTGKNLIGIFANHNVHHAMAQHTELRLNGDGILLDGEFHSDLNSQKTKDGKSFISRNLATMIAAVVDNAKDPLSNFLNVNTYTADVLALMFRLGMNFHSSAYFVAQPVVKEVSSNFFNGTQTISEELVVIDDMINQLKQKVENYYTKSGKQYIPSTKNKNITQKELLNNLVKHKQIQDMKKAGASASEIMNEHFDYYENQLSILYRFRELKLISSELSSLIQSTRPDASGVGPTLSESEKKIRDVKNLRFKIKRLDNWKDFLSSNKPIKMINNFYEYGIVKPYEELKQHFAWGSSGFMTEKNGIEGEKLNGSLTVEEIEFINYQLFSYLTQSYPLLSFSGEEGRSKKADLLLRFPSRLQEYKINNPQSPYVTEFLNRFRVISKDDGRKVIEYYRTGVSGLEKQDLTNMWDQMLNSNNETNRNLAYDLAMYSFIHSGFNLSSSSFTDLLPVNFYLNLGKDQDESFMDYMFRMKKDSESNDNLILSNFYGQFIRHHFDKHSFVSEAILTGDNKNISYFEKGTYSYENGLYTVTKEYPSTIVIEKELIKKWLTNNKLMPNYIMATIDDVDYLLRATETNSKRAVYTITQRLGKPYGFIEYSADNLNVESIFNSNRLYGTIGSPIEETHDYSVESEEADDVSEPVSKTNNYSWARYSDNSYEVSSQGDKRFSALYAKLKDGRTIEEAYQLDIKGYRTKGNDWKLGKGKKPLNNKNKEQIWQEYKNLWVQYLNENPDLEKDLREKAAGKVLTDKFATTDVSQARALSEILNNNISNTVNNQGEQLSLFNNPEVKTEKPVLKVNENLDISEESDILEDADEMFIQPIDDLFDNIEGESSPFFMDDEDAQKRKDDC